MARFSQAFLQGLLQPTYQQGLFEAARSVGQTPGIMRMEQQRKEEEAKQLSQIDQLVTTSTQATAAAQQGDVSAVTRQINELRQQMNTATTVDQKKMYAQEIRNLQQLIPGTRKISTNNTAQAIVKAEQALLDPTLPKEVKEALEKRIVEMKKNPDAVAQYNSYKLDQWRTDKAQQEMEAQAWIEANGPTIQTAIQEGDIEQVETLVSGAGEFSRAAQTYVDSVISSQAAMDKFEENSMKNKIAPNTKVEEDLISALPEELQKQFKPLLAAYKKAVEEGWNGKEWQTGKRIIAEKAQQTLMGLYRNTINQIATSEYFADRRAERDTQETIRRLELSLEAPIDPADIRAQARILNPDKDDITQQDLDAAEQNLRATRNKAIANQIASLKPEEEREEPEPGTEDDGGFSTKIGNKVTTRKMVSEAVAAQGKENVVRSLQEAGATDGQIAALLGEDLSERAPTQEELITQSGLINPARARLKLQQSLEGRQ